jgi:hypothetical protein
MNPVLRGNVRLVRAAPGRDSNAGGRRGSPSSGPHPEPNKGLQATANSVRSCLAPALRRA